MLVFWNHDHLQSTLMFIVIARLIIFISKIKNNISEIILPSRLTFFVWKSEELGYKLVWPNAYFLIFSLPEQKAQLIKICPFSVVGVGVGVVVVVYLSHVHLLLQNQWVNFNQIWHKASFGEVDPSLFKWKAFPFSKGR